MQTIVQSRTPVPMSAEPIELVQIPSASRHFGEVLRLRQAAYRREEAAYKEIVDEYSLHFGAYARSQLIGSLRVTCRRDGPFECEDHYPVQVVREHSDLLCACSRMCLHPQWIGSKIPDELARFAWRAVLPMGIRLDISKARLKAIPFYLKMGMYYLRDSLFSFDKWDATCGLIACPASPDHGTRFADLFQGITTPFNMSVLYDCKFTNSYKAFRDNAMAIDRQKECCRDSTD